MISELFRWRHCVFIRHYIIFWCFSPKKKKRFRVVTDGWFSINNDLTHSLGGFLICEKNPFKQRCNNFLSVSRKNQKMTQFKKRLNCSSSWDKYEKIRQITKIPFPFNVDENWTRGSLLHKHSHQASFADPAALLYRNARFLNQRPPFCTRRPLIKRAILRI